VPATSYSPSAFSNFVYFHLPAPAFPSLRVVCLSVNCKVPPVEQLGRFWVDSLVHSQDALNLAVKTLGAWHRPRWRVPARAVATEGGNCY
jgi:hypothetical protein